MKLTIILSAICLLPGIAHGMGLVEDLKREGLTTLLDFVVQAGLADALQEPLTIFAPSNRAFAKLPSSTVQALKNNPDLLKKTLLYHVILGASIKSGALERDNNVETAAGAKLRVTANGPMVNVYFAKIQRKYKLVMANGKRVTEADIPVGSSSVVHVIDEVIPFLDPNDDIPTVLTKAGNFKTLLQAVQAAGLAGALSGDGPFTVFAPNDAAFAKVPSDVLNGLLADKEALTGVLTKHVLPEAFYANTIKSMNYVRQSLNPKEQIKAAFFGQIEDKMAKVKSSSAQAKIVKADLIASNGVVHEIDTVI